MLVGSDAPLRFAAQAELDAAAWEDALCALGDRAGMLRLAEEPELPRCTSLDRVPRVRPSLERLSWYRDNLAGLMPIGDEAFADGLVAPWQNSQEFAELWPQRRRAQRGLLELIAEEERAKMERFLAARGAAVAPPQARDDEARLARWEALDREARSSPTTRAELERRLAEHYLRACVERLQRASRRATSFDEARVMLREASGLAERLQRLRPQRFDAWLYGGAALFLLSADPALEARELPPLGGARRDRLSPCRGAASGGLRGRRGRARARAALRCLASRRNAGARWSSPRGSRARRARRGARVAERLATLCDWIRGGAELDDLYFRAFRAVQIERALWTRRLSVAEPAEDQRAAFEILARWLPRARNAKAR